ncbi:GIY-YIG nuclease family protein [Congregibacter sp.]|uniref:GIY-YIG nuclease family protein n=1 Tax=Congregibacter sp. TaxID=2744308 RepID=UPI003F6B3492
MSVELQWLVYILRCADETLYTGVTRDLGRRLRQHNGELVGGANYTRARRPVVAIWFEECDDRSSAQVREAEIKRLSRRDKLSLVRSSPQAIPAD